MKINIFLCYGSRKIYMCFPLKSVCVCIIRSRNNIKQIFTTRTYRMLKKYGEFVHFNLYIKYTLVIKLKGYFYFTNRT